MKKFITLVAILSCLAAVAAGGNAPAKEKKETSETKVSMPDGIALATDVYLPGKKGRYPVVLVRTPYNKAAEKWMGKAFGLFGIAVVVQDVRGRYNSDGEYYPFVNERADGLATLRWIRSQPWSDGTVAGWGGSYVGYTQWAISDSLDFLSPLLTGANLYDFAYPDGLFSLQTAFIWGFQNASKTTNTIKPEKLAAAAMILPLPAADDSTIKDIDFIDDWIAHEQFDDYWKQMDFRGITKAPVLSMAGWQDIFLKTQIEDFQALQAGNNSSNHLVIGPWCHGSQGEKNEYGGLKKTGNPKLIYKYVKKTLKGKNPKLASPLKDAKYNLFIMERNEYVGSETWPPAETRSTQYYFGPSGYLGTTPGEKSGSLGYIYSPSDPYPSIGGTALGTGVGPARQNANADRKDQLVFELPVTGKPLILLGPVDASLWVSSSVTCTDFMVGIQDVFPDGKIINIQEGGARVTFSGPGCEKKDISVWATGYQINPGHKLRVFISSSWFPRYNRCLNTCEPVSTAMKFADAEQKVWYGSGTPSSISLPVYEPVKKK